jgi:hypothetical protein
LNEPTVIPLLMAEAEEVVDVPVTSSLGETILQHQNNQHSGEGYAAHGSGPHVEPDPGDKDWHDALLSGIADTKPILSDKEREQFEERHGELQNERLGQEVEEYDAKEAAKAAEAEAEESEEGEESEEALTDNPLELFAPEDVQAWAEHFGLAEEDLENPAVQKMLGKAMTEAAEEQQAQAQTAQQSQGQPEGQPMREPTQQEFDAHAQQLRAIAADPRINSPVMQRAFASGIAKYFGDGSAEAQQHATGFAELLTMGGISLMSSALPAMMSHYLPSMLEAAVPGLASLVQDATAANSWEAAREQFGRSLPAMDSPEFQALRDEVLRDNPWFESIQWKDGNGRPLDPRHPLAIQQAASAFARLATGQKLSPETIAKAVETGKKEAQSHARKVTASRSLSAGRSRNSFTRESRDEFRETIAAYNKSQHGNFEE